MSGAGADVVHITRISAQQLRHERAEVLCGYGTPNGGNRVSGPPDMATCWKCILLQCGRPIPPEPPLPEHARLTQAKQTDDATQLVGEFMCWLDAEKKIVLAERGSIELYPVQQNIQNLLAEYFGINQNALESEKQAMLNHLRATNTAREWALSEGRAALALK